MSVTELCAAVQTPLLVLMGVVSAVSFFMMGADKLQAKAGRRRIRERTLLLSAALFGGIGAYLGMALFHHKTRKPPFPVLLPLFAVFQAALAAAVIMFARTG